MKKIVVGLTLTLFVLRAAADVFIASSNEVVFLTVPANQTMLISSVKFGTFDNSGSANMVMGMIVQNGATNLVSLVNKDFDPHNLAYAAPYALNGPCQIAFVMDSGDPANPAPAPVAVSYRFLQNSPIHCLLASPNSTNVISVPAGKNIRFFGVTFLWGNTGYGIINLQNGTNTLYNVLIDGGDEFAGPLTLTAVNPAGSYSQLISYYFTDAFFAVPDTGYIQGPTGSFEIAVEKSADLNAWSPVVVYNTGSDQKAFYRLRIQK